MRLCLYMKMLMLICLIQGSSKDTESLLNYKNNMHGVNFESQKSSPIFNSNKFSVFIEFWPGDLQISRQMNTNVPPCLPPVLKLSKKGQDCKAFCPHLKNGPTIIFNYVSFLFSVRLIVKLVLYLDLVLGD